MGIRNGIVASLLMFAVTVVHAELDLRNASVTQLDNGLTIILLEDRNFPVVSVQALYRIGARDETTGQTGLAHFLEHMAFRSTASFPGTGVVSEIYARGGEWHGYTWTDQTTYFATVPKENLDLLLRIEAERMSALTIDADDMEAERGAVLAEMHGYENSPSTVLFDAVLFASFQGHPYRNNTIGWESDIENLQHEDVVAFYERHYVPANAVIAIVGDFDTGAVMERVSDLFGDIEAGPATPLPHTVEPPQTGERRVRLSGPGDSKYFKIAWRAPSATSPDYAAFLVLQDLLGGSSGVSFLQNDWGTPVRSGSLLDGAADDLSTWFPPSAQDYVFLVSGTAPANADDVAIETSIGERIALARDEPPGEATLSASIERMLDELVFDLETTEDAAHQLAFFDGLGALDVLLQLPERLRAVQPRDVQSVARRYLQPQQRTIGWWVPGSTTAQVGPALANRELASASGEAGTDDIPASAPVVRRLDGGVPLVVVESDLSASAYLRVVVPDPAANSPVLGHTSVDYRVRADDFGAAVSEASQALQEFEAAAATRSSDPETRLEQAMMDVIGATPRAATTAPAVILAAGDLRADDVFDAMNAAYGDLVPGQVGTVASPGAREPAVEIQLGRPIAQAQLAYVFEAPPPSAAEANAYRLMLYILSHAYEGRLGKKAISDRGLVYYIDSHYRSDGRSAWITMATGVDPQKLPAMESLLQSEIARLESEPPTAAEIAEARQHLVGRARSAAQSNEELTAELARQWIWYGNLQSPAELQEALERVSDEQVRATAAAFARGTVITVTE